MFQENYVNQYDSVVNNINTLIELDDIKSQVMDLVKFIFTNKGREDKLGVQYSKQIYNSAFIGKKSNNLNELIGVVKDVIINNNVINNDIVNDINVIEINLKDIYAHNSIFRKNSEDGYVFIIDCEMNDIRRNYDENILLLDLLMKRHRQKSIFILSANNDEITKVRSLGSIDKKIFFNIYLRDLEDIETLNIIKRSANNYGYEIEKKAEKVILSHINYYKEINCFENIYTAEEILNKAIVESRNREIDNVLKKSDFIFRRENKKATLENKFSSKSNYIKGDSKNPIKELESMIGLRDVKINIREIINFVNVQSKRKELGLSEDKISYHMCFSGAPGTGKTTVARLVGQALKELGVLSKGQFVEASRENLCGKYVGHTATMTKAKIDEARGGVLFIDEAYSLASSSRVDFGREAINTLVKYMEEYRDDLVVILAGYTDDMERLLDMNDGLRSRIPFKIEFSNYNNEELAEIWVKFYENNNYIITEEAKRQLNLICNEYNNMDLKDNGNARTIRKYFERSKMIQATRIIEQNISNKNDLITINEEDIVKLYNEIIVLNKNDTSKILEVKSERRIGFIR